MTYASFLKLILWILDFAKLLLIYMNYDSNGISVTILDDPDPFTNCRITNTTMLLFRPNITRKKNY